MSVLTKRLEKSTRDRRPGGPPELPQLGTTELRLVWEQRLTNQILWQLLNDEQRAAVDAQQENWAP